MSSGSEHILDTVAIGSQRTNFQTFQPNSTMLRKYDVRIQAKRL